MATNVTLLNLSRRSRRIGTVNFPGYTPASAVVTVDIASLDRVSRRQIQKWISNGSIVAASAANSVKIVSIDQGSRSRNRIGAINMADLVQNTFDLTAGTQATSFDRRDLIQLLQSGSAMATHGTNACTLYNVSSKKIRVGSVFVNPLRLTGGVFGAQAVITFTGNTGLPGYKITYNAIEDATEFVVGTNFTAAALQTALRTDTGDTGLVVSGTTDTGPFTVTYSDGFTPLSALSVAHASAIQTITLTGDTGTLTFKLTYNSAEGATVFTRGTNQTAAAIQAALRAVGGTLANVRVSGTTDAGPFIVAFPAGVVPLTPITVTSGTGGLTGATVSTALAGTVADAAGGLAGGGPAALQIADTTALNRISARIFKSLCLRDSF